MGDRDPPAGVNVGALGRAILEAADGARIGVAVSEVDGPGPRCIYVNEAAADMLGYPVEAILARDPMSFIAPEDRTRMREHFAKRHAGEVGDRSYELTIQRGDGRPVVLAITTSSASVDGRPVVFSFVVDATARVEAERARRRTEAQFRYVMEIAPEPFGIIRDGRFVYANQAYAKALGVATVEELYGFPLRDRLEPEDSVALGAREPFVNDGGQLVPRVYRWRRGDGTTVQLESCSGPCDFEGQPAVITMARDVSARKALEAQLLQADRLAAIGTMAAGVAHEINNPLAYLMLNLDWIARKLPEGARDPESIAGLIELLREAHRGAERVASIVRELRAFSRADGETRKRVDVAAVVRSAIKMSGHEIRHRARVTTSFAPARAVWANESRLEQVVLNLLLNAAHAMPERRLANNEIHVVLQPEGADGLVLEVTDNGEGIAPEVVSRIFDPFFTTKPRGTGMGLGLSICHGIVTGLGGRITVKSAPGEGTTFRVSLPTTDREDAEAEAAPISQPTGERPAPRARVLVVDDEVPIANTLRDLLGMNHDVTATHSARDALAAIQARNGKGDFDVIFCDLMMPGKSGIELYEDLLGAAPALAKKMVFMTGGAFTARAAEFLTAIGNRRIEKPFSLALIERLIESILHEKAPRAETACKAAGEEV
jgi:PAS domain S-box-containing protein